MDAVYHYFLHPGKKPGEVIFKPRNLKVELVITARNWDKIQEHLANQEPMGRSSLGPGGNPGLFLDPPAEIVESDTWSPPPLSQILHNVGKPPSSHQLASVLPSVMESAGLPSRTSILSDQVPIPMPSVDVSSLYHADIESAPDRQAHRVSHKRPLSMPTSPECTPRPKKSNSPEWQSPDRAVLRSVLQQQVANVKLPSSEVQHAIEFFPILLKAFNEMLSSCPSPDFSVHAYHGHLYTDPQTELAPPGSFKTAHPGRLSLDAPQTLVPPALGMIPYESIAVKRAYYKETIRGKDRVKHFSGAYEVDIMGREGKALYWAMSLMDMVYCFVKRHVGKAAVSQEGFAVPEVRFVNAGLAIIWNTEGKATKALLLEQLIDASQGLFRKFVHNGSAKPLPDCGSQDYNLACFLCFAQHVQWMKTGGLAFVSDFQGGDTLLSDPQIMTHPALAAIFSQGNVAAAFRSFPDQHECNHFCAHFGLLAPEPFEEDAGVDMH
ncbi:hypothetical protein JB92DRAFT_877399 [Gautieria morchelliformis]|nr:hypothetical protein JB92DRAFT_877399 [Gautieria morchelliformis]